MFEPGDFDISLETSLKLRVMQDEVDHCDDMDALKKNLKEVTGLLVRYQKILDAVMKRVIEDEVSKMLGFDDDVNNVK